MLNIFHSISFYTIPLLEYLLYCCDKQLKLKRQRRDMHTVDMTLQVINTMIIDLFGLFFTVCVDEPAPKGRLYHLVFSSLVFICFTLTINCPYSGLYTILTLKYEIYNVCSMQCTNKKINNKCNIQCTNENI